VKYGIVVISVILSQLIACLPVDPPLPHTIEKPLLQCDGFVVAPDISDGYREAIHLQWSLSDTETALVSTYTLLRKFSFDSVFDVFTGSRLIPADTFHFYDELINYVFPANGIDSVFYRILAIDTLGRAGDTSDIVRLKIAPQPKFGSYDEEKGCCSWESWIRGGIFSWCTVRHETETIHWTSERQEKYPDTDQPAVFSACFPDTLFPPPSGRWYYGFFIRANDAYSLSVRAIDVQ
jgi:hypothetical protein